MEIINRTLEDVKSSYRFSDTVPLSDYLYVDIETTGFTPRTSKLYLIGCVFYRDDVWQTTQFFADKYSDEPLILEEFCFFAKDFKYLVHFNGNTFDIPYLTAKCKEFNVDCTFSELGGIDIYKRIAPLRNFLRLENCKQKTLERFLGIDREDRFSGGDLIGIYHSYVSNSDSELKRLLLLHNFEDIKGMPEVSKVLSYSDLLSKEHTVTKVSANRYNDESGNEKTELLISFDIDDPLPVPVSFIYDTCYFTGEGNRGFLKVPLYTEEMKYFYANHKDYYYLPDEDIALHKSVASFVDKAHRVQAKAANCYTRKYSDFLPQWDVLFTPFFKRDYESRDLFFELTDEAKTDREMFKKYVSHILNHMSM